MNANRKTVLAVVLCAAACPQRSLAQAPLATILVIDYENQVSYIGDIADPSKFATDPGVTTVTTPKNFYQTVTIADIKAVNGQPATGTYMLRYQVLNLGPNPSPGQAIADIANSFSTVSTWQILKPDGTQIGTLMGVGLGGASGAVE